MNKVMLMGNLTSSPELKRTQADKAFCNFTVAIKKSFRNKQGGYDGL